MQGAKPWGPAAEPRSRGVPSCSAVSAPAHGTSRRTMSESLRQYDSTTLGVTSAPEELALRTMVGLEGALPCKYDST
jgi:hypothetical protein